MLQNYQEYLLLVEEGRYLFEYGQIHQTWFSEQIKTSINTDLLQ